jgi:peptide/nickel transport system substrate-binding protein
LEPTTLDPNIINSNTFPWRNTIFDPLISIPVTDIKSFKLGNIQTWLASSYKPSADYTSVTMTIRQGVKYHDGKTMTPQDVADSINFSLTPASAGSIQVSLAAVKEATVNGQDVVVTFKQPSVDGLYRLTLFRVQPLSNHANVTKNPIGTGPFKFVEHVAGDHMTVERFTDYWKPIDSNIQKIVFHYYSDPDALVSAALSNQIDILQFGRTSDAATLSGGGWNTYNAPISDYLVWMLNYKGKSQAMLNNDFRQGLARSVDRVNVAKVSYDGLTSPITIPDLPSHPTYDKTIADEWNFDLNSANSFFQKSGFSKASFQLVARSNQTDTVQAAQIIKASLAQIGVTVNIDLRDQATAVQQAAQGAYESWLMFCNIGIPEVQDFEDCGNNFNPKALPFTTYNDAYNTAAATTDPAQRVAAFKQVWKALHEGAWAIPICMRGSLFAQKSNISGVQYDAKTHLVYTSIQKT